VSREGSFLGGDYPRHYRRPSSEGSVIVPVADQNLPTFEEGDAVARLEIPEIGVNDIVVAGVTTRDLKKGPGHFPDTPLPGQLGNSGLAR
jgi:sortase (surface protein transpeptidase)